jgi:opacity protein-like surface antigen
MSILKRHSYRSPAFAGPAVALVILLAPPALQAQPAPGFYGGAGVGLASFSVDDDPYDCCYPYGYPYGYSDYDDGDDTSATSLSLGYRVNSYLAAEFGYFESSMEWQQSLVYMPVLNDVYNNFVDVDLRASQFSAAGILPFANIWEAYARGGITYSQGETSQTLVRVSDSSVSRRDFDESGTSFFFAAGMAVSPKPAWQLRLEFQYFGVDRDLISAAGSTWVSSIMFGFQFRPEGWQN